MSATSTSVPYRPGPIGRIVRLILGLLVLQAAIEAVLRLVDGVSGFPGTDDVGLLVAIVVAAWLTPTVYDIGLGTNHGNQWRLVAAAGIGAAALGGLAIGAPGTGLTIGILVWVAITLGWLGVAFLVATVLRTPGCEMRSLPHLASLVLPGERDFVACPGPLQPLDEWEARSTGRAERNRAEVACEHRRRDPPASGDR